MLRSILMKFMVQAALMYGIVTYVSELSQNLVGMNEKFWAVWKMRSFWESKTYLWNTVSLLTRKSVNNGVKIFWKSYCESL